MVLFSVLLLPMVTLLSLLSVAVPLAPTVPLIGSVGLSLLLGSSAPDAFRAEGVVAFVRVALSVSDEATEAVVSLDSFSVGRALVALMSSSSSSTDPVELDADGILDSSPIVLPTEGCESLPEGLPLLGATAVPLGIASSSSVFGSTLGASSVDLSAGETKVEVKDEVVPLLVELEPSIDILLARLVKSSLVGKATSVPPTAFSPWTTTWSVLKEEGKGGGEAGVSIRSPTSLVVIPLKALVAESEGVDSRPWIASGSLTIEINSLQPGGTAPPTWRAAWRIGQPYAALQRCGLRGEAIESPINLSKRSFRCSQMQNVARMRKPAVKAETRIRLAATVDVAIILEEDDEDDGLRVRTSGDIIGAL